MGEQGETNINIFTELKIYLTLVLICNIATPFKFLGLSLGSS